MNLSDDGNLLLASSSQDNFIRLWKFTITDRIADDESSVVLESKDGFAVKLRVHIDVDGNKSYNIESTNAFVINTKMNDYAISLESILIGK